MDPTDALRDHLRNFFVGHSYEEHHWKDPLALAALPDLHIAVIGPGPKTPLWFYATLGAWQFGDRPGGSEFFMLTQQKNDRFLELLAIAAFHHRNHDLRLHHTAPLSEPMLPGSRLEYVYVSLPYTFGPKLEICKVENVPYHFYWLFPITADEREFAMEHSFDDLEDAFEKRNVQYWSATRESVVD